MNQITDEMLEKIGILAKLDLLEEEKQEVKLDMERMMDYFDKLKELDTDDVEPMSHTFSLQNVFREDEVRNKNKKDSILSNAPKKKNGYFQVPKTIN